MTDSRFVPYKGGILRVSKNHHGHTTATAFNPNNSNERHMLARQSPHLFDVWKEGRARPLTHTDCIEYVRDYTRP